MVKVWFPNMFMRLISGIIHLYYIEKTNFKYNNNIIYLVNLKKKPPTAVLYVPPKMTKFEINQYLTKIYNVTVSNVNTENILGKYTINIINNN